MFHVEQFVTSCDQSGINAGFEVLVVETKQNNDTEDDGRDEDLTDVVVKDLLVGAGDVAESGLFLGRCFGG